MGGSESKKRGNGRGDSVMDSGKGIAKQLRDKVGQPFFYDEAARTWNGAGTEHFERDTGSAWRAFEPGRGVRTYAICGDVAGGSDLGERTCGFGVSCRLGCRDEKERRRDKPAATKTKTR